MVINAKDRSAGQESRDRETETETERQRETETERQSEKQKERERIIERLQSASFFKLNAED